MKLNAVGSALSYSTFLGGAGWEQGFGIAVDSAGSAYASGTTEDSSPGFPTTAGAFDTSHNGGDDVYLTKFHPAGSALAYSTFIGSTGNDFAGAVAVDGAGSAYVTGGARWTDFPTTAEAFDTTLDGFSDAFAAKLNAAGSALSYSTLIGGMAEEAGLGIAVDETGNLYVAGNTYSADFPTTAGAYDTGYSGAGDDGFVTKIASPDAFDDSVAPGDTAATNQTVTLGDPVGTSITNPSAGSVTRTVTLQEEPTSGGPPSGYDLLGWQVDITISPDATAADPLEIAFRLDASLLPTGMDETNVEVFRNGTLVPDCTGPPGTASPDPCVSNREAIGGGDIELTVLTSQASVWNLGISDIAPYPLPQGATPLRLPLVPAMNECSSPNSTHAGPLFPDQSCTDPQIASSTATLGSSTDSFARLGHARTTVCNTIASPGCSAVGTAPDVRLLGNGSDIVCKPGAAPAACPGGTGSDYDPNPAASVYTSGLTAGTNSNSTAPTPLCGAGNPNCGTGADMTARAEIPGSTSTTGTAIRVTDSNNQNFSIGDPSNCGATTSCSATVQDQRLDVPVVCQATGAGIGSYCGANTTANALVPGVVVSGKGAIVELGQIRVFDSGPDGVRLNGDDELFAVQGIVVP